jgi:hypothetical protein
LFAGGNSKGFCSAGAGVSAAGTVGVAVGAGVSDVAGAEGVEPDAGKGLELAGAGIDSPSFGPIERAPAPDVVVTFGSASISSVSGRYHQQTNAHKQIQSRTETAVIRVKMSPALTPKALEPPEPPKAPVRPPPLPRWSKMIKMMKTERRNNSGPKMY